VPGRTCPARGPCAYANGRARRIVLTAAGDAHLERLYLVCPRCQASHHPLDDRPGLTGFVSPAAQRLLCLAGASWSFDRASAHLKELCGLSVCDNTIRRVCHEHGGAARDWRRDDPAAVAAFGAAAGEVESQTDGTAVNTTAGWREKRLSVFAKRHPGGPGGRLPAPHTRVLAAGVVGSDRLGPQWRRMAARLGVRDTSEVAGIADGAEGTWAQADKALPGAAGVLDFYHASERLYQAGRELHGETPAAVAWADARRGTLLAAGGAALRADLAAGGPKLAGAREYFRPHAAHLDYPGRRAAGRSIGSGLVEGACQQVVGRRLKQTGARWRVRRAERMATLCGLIYSGLWETYWAAAA
jgi:hypothetical protein